MCGNGTFLVPKYMGGVMTTLKYFVNRMFKAYF